MSTPGAGVLLALSGDDADILRALSQAGSGLCVVRRCADLPELLSAGMAGLASFALLDTGFDEIDRTVLDRLARAGLSGLLLVEGHEEERWRSVGWPVMRRDASPGRVCSAMQDIVRRGATDAGASSVGPANAPGATSGEAAGAASEAVTGPLAAGDDWLRATTPASAGSGNAAQETAWLEELWRRSPGPDRTGEPTERPGAVAPPSRPPSGPLAIPPSAAPVRPHAAVNGRIVVVWGPHGAPGRSTVAASLAHGLADSGGAILVDADVEAPSLVQLLGMPEDSSALAGAARLATHGRLDAESFQRVLAPVGTGLFLMGGLGRAGRWRELPPASMTEVWLQCRQAAAWTVVDVAGGVVDDDVDDFTLEPGRGAVTADLVSHADVVLVVGGADPVGVRRLLQLLDEMRSSMTPAGRVEVVVNRVRASAAGPSPQQALREALARFGGLEDIVLLPDDAATADACLLQGRSVLEGAPGSALGKALSALVDRIDPQTATDRRARSSRRSLLRRSQRRGRKRDSAERTRTAGGGRRSAERGEEGARHGSAGRGATLRARVATPQGPQSAARATQQSGRALPPSIQPSGQSRVQSPNRIPPPTQDVPAGPARWPGAAPWRDTGAGSVPDPGADRGAGWASDAGHGAARAGDPGRGRRSGRGHDDPPPAPPGTGRHRY
ncbi:hypothetical protein [Actinomyces sp. ZJ308]|uniref:hypothetical protein n=1 Tax=Actinomyces sp. ZJ308 TaxID=2708342 RepID=UPI00141E2A61|nr:hypothetical protein [Actinomyces sp. ZJ308]